MTDSSVFLDTLQDLALPIKPWALVFGHEVFGVAQKVLDKVDICIEIPQYGAKLSMNVAIAMSIVIWELLKKII